MPTKAKNIRIFLADGVPNGLMVAEIGNWVGKVLVVPRSSTLIPTLAARKETNQTGLYVLSGPDLTASVYREMVYIGESDNVLTRLSQHLTDPKKDFWERTVLIVSKDNNLTKAHVRYLEYRLINIAQQAGRAALANGNNGISPNLPEGDTADMEAFLEEIQVLLPVLGFPFAQPVPKVVNSSGPSAGDSTGSGPTTGGATGSSLGGSAPGNGLQGGPSTQPSPQFILNAAGLTAEAQEINGEFVVIKGSQAKPLAKPSLRPGIINLRDQLRKDGKIIDNPNGPNWLFAEDVPFNSPSAASDIIFGYSTSGPISWKVKGTNQTYKDWQLAQSVILPNPINPE